MADALVGKSEPCCLECGLAIRVAGRGFGAVINVPATLSINGERYASKGLKERLYWCSERCVAKSIATCRGDKRQGLILTDYSAIRL